MTDDTPQKVDETPYLTVLTRMIFPHAYLNKGRGFLDWKWIAVSRDRDRARWFFTYRFEAGMVWAVILTLLVTGATEFYTRLPGLALVFRTGTMFWLLYGLVLVFAMRWSTPGMPRPETMREKRDRKRSKKTKHSRATEDRQ